MKKTLLALLTAVVMVVVARTGMTQPKKCCETPTGPCDLKKLDVKLWDDVFYDLVPRPDENGNAVTYIMEATHGKIWGPGGEAGPNDLETVYPWWGEVKNSFWEGEDDESKALIRKAIAIPELDMIVKASKQKGYQFYGIYAMPSPDPDITFMELPIPAHVDTMRLVNCLIARAYDRLAKGDNTGAENDLMAVARLGHTMQKSAILMDLYVGCAIEKKAAQEFPKIYEKTGETEAAAEWAEFLEMSEIRTEAIKTVYRNRDSELTLALADNESLPLAIRVEALIVGVGKVFGEKKTAVITGLPDDVKKFLLKEHFTNPEAIILQFEIQQDLLIGPMSTRKGRMVFAAAFSEP